MQMKERYTFMFEYENEWMIVLYENGRNVKYFNNSDNDWDDALDYVDLFLENGGNMYQYELPSYSYIIDLDIFNLKNQPLEELAEYLHKMKPDRTQDMSEDFTEIERKWLLKKVPEEFPLIIDAVCEQAYLSQEPEVRIRKNAETGKQPSYFIDVKSNGSLRRTEISNSISEIKYKAMKEMLEKPVIDKKWFLFDIDSNQPMEVTIVDPGSDTEFIYAEIEFHTEKEAKDFIFPIEDAIEVTDDMEYQMKNYWKRTRT